MPGSQLTPGKIAHHISEVNEAGLNGTAAELLDAVRDMRLAMIHALSIHRPGEVNGWVRLAAAAEVQVWAQVLGHQPPAELMTAWVPLPGGDREPNTPTSARRLRRAAKQHGTEK